MANYRNGGSRGGGDRGGFRPRDDRPKEMHSATCSSCGKSCQVPFRPTGDKPVFCRDCFSKQGGGRELGRQAGERGNLRESNSDIKRELENVNSKLERLIVAVQALAVTAVSPKIGKISKSKDASA